MGNSMASLQPGVRVATAPRFNIASEWQYRLSLNSGFAIDDGHIYPRDDWRSPTQSEIDLLTAKSDPPTNAILLFNIPEGLHAKWWLAAAESSNAPGMESDAIKNFANDVLEYLNFKKVPLPPVCLFETILTSPGQPCTQVNAESLQVEQRSVVLVGGINLSDEEAVAVFMNLGETHCFEPASATLEERRRTVLLKCRDYPLTRIRLRPREGYLLPHEPVFFDRDTLGRNEIDVHLAIKRTA
jgi:hypothetical protein